MSAATVTAVNALSSEGAGAYKVACISITGPASYDTGGSLIDLSSANTALLALQSLGYFTAVHGVKVIGIAAAAANVYSVNYIRASAGAPATGKLVIRDITASSAAEVTSTTDLSTVVFHLEVLGK